MKKIAFVFPGQGAQYVGMAREIAEQSAPCREMLKAADARLGYKLSELMFEGPAETLTLTENAQPALVAASMACYELLKEAGIVPEMVCWAQFGRMCSFSCRWCTERLRCYLAGASAGALYGSGCPGRCRGYGGRIRCCTRTSGGIVRLCVAVRYLGDRQL